MVRSAVGAAVLVLAALAYYFNVGFWVADADTRGKFQGVDLVTVQSVETDIGDVQHVTDVEKHEREVGDLLNALRQSRTRQGYKPPKDAAPGYIRVRTVSGGKIENLTVFFPADSIRDRLGPEVDKAVRAVHAAGRPKG